MNLVKYLSAPYHLLRNHLLRKIPGFCRFEELLSVIFAPDASDAYEDELEERETEGPPSFALHPVRGVAWAAVWGSPLAAGIVLAINYWRVGKKKAARIAVASTVVATAALFTMLLAIPEDVIVPYSFFYFPQVLVVYVVAKRLQGDLIANHESNGGTVEPVWPSYKIGFICLPFMLGTVLGVHYLLEPYYGTLIEFGDDKIYYLGEASDEDARKLAGVLEESEFFGADGASARLEISSAAYTVSFMLADKDWDRPEILDTFRNIGSRLVESGYPTPLTIQMCDQYFEPKKTLSVY